MQCVFKCPLKTVRKFFGEAIVVTQEIEDIISSPVVKQAIYLQLIYLKAKARWAEWMDRNSTSLGARKIKILFIVLTALFGTLCLLLILSGGKLFYTEPSLRPDIIQTIRAPSATITTASPSDTLAIKKIRAFHSYMKNLSVTEGGRKTRDSILEARSGLMDSIRILEAMYNYNKDE